MRVVCISDTHERHRKVEVPDGDVLIHAGDFTMIGERKWIEDFNDWLGSLPHKHKIVIAGNHDFGMAEHAALLTNCTYLQDSGVEIEGIKFYGSPFTPTFGRWAFMLDRGKTILEKWLQIPEDTDVLITHTPPYGILDRPMKTYNPCGCEDLAVVVKAIEPKLHVFGHIHGGYGEHIEGTHYVNASVSNEAYQPVNAPIVTEIFK